MPGPGNYESDIHAFGKNSKGFTIQGKDKDKYNDVPGPGSYNQAESLT